MKKTAMKVLALVMCALLAATALVGCGGNKADTILIGATGPLSGDAASYGNSVQNGALIAIDEINAAGGLNGIKFAFKMIDDEASADKVTAAYDTLIAEGMVVSTGSVTSGSCAQFAALSKEDNVFFMTPSASAEPCIAESNAYRICFGDPDQGVLAAEELVKAGYTNIGVIYASDDSYSSGIYEAFEAKMTELGKTFTMKSFTESTSSNFTQQVTDLKAQGCDVVFLPIYYQPAWLIIKEADTLGFDVDFFGCDGLDGIYAYSENSDLVKGVKYLTPFDVNSTDETVSAFVTAYKAKYNAEPDQFAADGYDAVMVIYKAMKEAGVDSADITASDLCDKITAVLNGEFTFVGATGTITWAETGAPTKSPIVITIG